MFFTLNLNHKMNKHYKINADLRAKSISIMEQVLGQIPIIKSYVMEKQIEKRIFNNYKKYYNSDMKITKWNSLLQSACASTSKIPRITYLIFAGYMVLERNMTLGALIAVFDLLNYIIGPTVYFPFMLNGLNRTIVSINRVKLLEEKLELTKHTNNVKSSFPKIRISELSFGYSKKNNIFKNFNFDYEGYGVLVFKGKSGVGKTTLLDLLAGLYDVGENSIKVHGKVTMIPQETFILNETVFENIRIANNNATDEMIYKAMKIAYAHKFVLEMQNQYQTLIGDGNIDLSGGQKQRISLARAIISDANIILMDEPTAALDVQTESLILQTIKKLSKEKLIIVSSHRQVVIDMADKVIDLDMYTFNKGEHNESIR